MPKAQISIRVKVFTPVVHGFAQWGDKKKKLSSWFEVAVNK